MKSFRLLLLATLMMGANVVHAEVYELRTYTTYDGRLDALLARFENHTMRLFENHGMHNVAYWVPQDKPNTLIYILSHPDREKAAQNWNAFRNNPEWQQIVADSQRDGQIVENVESIFMDATPWSPMQ